MNPGPTMAPPEPPRAAFHSKFRIVLLVVFTGEIGVFLMCFPWLPMWHYTSITHYVPWLAYIWDSPYFRGAISGLGAVNLYISLLEILKLRRTPGSSQDVPPPLPPYGSQPPGAPSQGTPPGTSPQGTWDRRW